MAAFKTNRPMKNSLRLALLFAAVALMGDLTLRQLPEKILARLELTSR